MSDLAKVLEIKERSLHRYLRGEREIPLGLAIRIEDAGGPPARWWLEPPE